MPRKLANTEEEILLIKTAFDGIKGARKIASDLGFTRHKVLEIYKILGIDNSSVTIPIRVTPKNKKCLSCDGMIDINKFRSRLKNNKTYYESSCNECESKYNKERLLNRYKESGREEFKKKYKDPKFRNKHLQASREWEERNKDKRRAYRKTPSQRERINKSRRIKLKENVTFKIRCNISNAIIRALKGNSGSKYGESCAKYLPYSFIELRDHIESLFEEWMSWDNWGVYDISTWNDNDKSTWAWQIDHIIPASDFKYKNMNDFDFLQCWSLINLRPLSAKTNIIDGVKRTRHK